MKRLHLESNKNLNADIVELYMVSQSDTSEKRCHYIFASNFVTCWLIFKILSPTDSSKFVA